MDAADDYFSYETCDPDNFDGNGWIGRVACTDKPNSFCTADVNTEMAGDSSCPCILPAQTQAVADGMPAYVNGTTYGYGCKAHNDFMDDVCKTLTDTAPGEANDWCKEKWCIVDPQNCAFKTGPGRAVAYSAATDDYFSYETCDPDNFDGNGWIGRVACTDEPDSFCTAGSSPLGSRHPRCASNTLERLPCAVCEPQSFLTPMAHLVFEKNVDGIPVFDVTTGGHHKHHHHHDHHKHHHGHAAPATTTLAAPTMTYAAPAVSSVVAAAPAISTVAAAPAVSYAAPTVADPAPLWPELLGKSPLFNSVANSLADTVGDAGDAGPATPLRSDLLGKTKSSPLMTLLFSSPVTQQSS